MSTTVTNSFTDGPLRAIYLKTALPIIFVMGMNGLLTVVDALFLGIYVGADALAAVTLMFPMYILIVALSTLVSSGMSSLLARHLGGERLNDARAVFVGAHGLAVVLGAILIVLFWVLGGPLSVMAAGGSQTLADMGHVYLGITVFFSPLLFVLSVNSDALRNEGHVGFMSAMSLLVSFANMLFNYILIAELEMGVAGSAYGTAAAQFSAFGIIFAYRMAGRTVLRPSDLIRRSLIHSWRDILALGAPQSLNFIGLALGSAAIMAALQWMSTASYGNTVSAYGIVTRVMTFGYLPLLGLSFAMQTITGNNYGAALWERTSSSLRVAIHAAFFYCLAIQLLLMSSAGFIAGWFVDDPAVIAEVARILPIAVSTFCLAGPLMMIAAYFQAIGFAGRAAILSLSKPYIFAIPLTFLLPLGFGEAGVWYAGPAAELMLLFLTAAVLLIIARNGGPKWGLFHVSTE